MRCEGVGGALSKDGPRVCVTEGIGEVVGWAVSEEEEDDDNDDDDDDEEEEEEEEEAADGER